MLLMLLVSVIGRHSRWLDSLLPTVLLLSFFLFLCFFITFHSGFLLTQFATAFRSGLMPQICLLRKFWIGRDPPPLLAKNPKNSEFFLLTEVLDSARPPPPPFRFSPKKNSFFYASLISSDRSSYSDDVLLLVPLFQSLSFFAITFISVSLCLSLQIYFD